MEYISPCLVRGGGVVAMHEVVEAVAHPQQPHHHEQLAVQQLRVLWYTVYRISEEFCCTVNYKKYNEIYIIVVA